MPSHTTNTPASFGHSDSSEYGSGRTPKHFGTTKLRSHVRNLIPRERRRALVLWWSDVRYVVVFEWLWVTLVADAYWTGKDSLSRLASSVGHGISRPTQHGDDDAGKAFATEELLYKTGSASWTSGTENSSWAIMNVQIYRMGALHRSRHCSRCARLLYPMLLTIG